MNAVSIGQDFTDFKMGKVAVLEVNVKEHHNMRIYYLTTCHYTACVTFAKEVVCEPSFVVAFNAIVA